MSAYYLLLWSTSAVWSRKVLHKQIFLSQEHLEFGHEDLTSKGTYCENIKIPFTLFNFY